MSAAAQVVPMTIDPRFRMLVAALVQAGYSAGLGTRSPFGDVVEVDSPRDRQTYSLRLETGKWIWSLDVIVSSAEDYAGAVAWVRATFGEPDP